MSTKLSMVFAVLLCAVVACGGDEPATEDQQAVVVWDQWVALWNGDLEAADAIVAPDFAAHFVPLDPAQPPVRGPAALKQWIGALVGGAFADVTFTTDVGPLIDGDLIAGRWTFEGTYRGGISGAPEAAVGRKVTFSGHDILRVHDGRIVEYWLSSDVQALMQQLGFFAQ
jgi:ketosteroid isomerase-like protein